LPQKIPGFIIRFLSGARQKSEIASVSGEDSLIWLLGKSPEVETK